MARSRLLPLALAAFGAFLASGASPARAHPGGGGDAAALEAQAKELRAKAASLRADGKEEDAAHLEEKAARCEAMIADARAAEAKRAEVKARIADLQARAEQAKAEGRMDEARAAMQEAEELSRKFAPKDQGPKWEAELVRASADLREKARALREQGSTADAEHLEEKAARMEKALELRRASNDLERRGKEAKAAGNEEEARALMEQSGRAWREADAILGAGAAEKRKENDLGGILRGSPDEVRRKIVALHDAARLLSESGMADRAEALEKQAAAAERELEARAAREAGGETAPGNADLAALRAEMERIRRRAAEIEEAIRKLEAR